MVTTTTYTSITVLQPVIVTSSKVPSNPQITKPTPEGQSKKALDKGKAKPFGKLKKNIAKSTTNVVTTGGPSANLQNHLRDKAKHTAALMQEIMDELQVIEEESSKEEQDSEATQVSDLEKEDSDNLLTDSEQ